MQTEVSLPSTSSKSIISTSKVESSFSIKNALKEQQSKLKVTEDKPILVHVTGRDAFMPKDVQKVLSAYIAENMPDNTIKIVLGQTPRVQGNEIILITSNDVQKEQLNTIHPALQNLLQTRLNNGAITLSYKDSESEESTQAHPVTNTEKLKLFQQENPVIEEMIKIFNLEIDY